MIPWQPGPRSTPIFWSSCSKWSSPNHQVWHLFHCSYCLGWWMIEFLKNIAIVVSFSILTLLHLCQRLLVTQCRSFSVDNITVISSSPWATTINKKNNNININFNNNTDNNTVMSYSPWTLWGSTVSLNSTVITMSQSSSDHQWYFDLKQAAKKSQQVTNGKNYQPLNYWFITN